MLISLAAVIAGAFFMAPTTTVATKPNIVMIIIDDWGWNNWGYHAKHQANFQEIHTPHLDSLATKHGIVLDRHYAGRICGPSRSSLLTGRNPIHVNVLNDGLGNYNLTDPISGFSGIPRNMTGIGGKRATTCRNMLILTHW